MNIPHFDLESADKTFSHYQLHIGNYTTQFLFSEIHEKYLLLFGIRSIFGTKTVNSEPHMTPVDKYI